MPVVASTAYSTAGEVMDLVRSLLNDIDFPFTTGIITPTGAVRDSNVVTITTTAAHGLTPGQRVTIGSVTDGSFNGTFVIDTVPSPTTFTYAQTGAGASSGNGTVELLSTGDVFTDTVLLPFTNLAYRKIQRRLGRAGNQNLTAQVDLVLIATDTYFGDTVSGLGSSALPTDFLAPRRLWERQSGSDQKFSEIAYTDALSDREQSSILGEYTWREDLILFVGSTENRDVRTLYQRALANLTGRDSQVMIRGALDAVAFLCATLAANSKGGQADPVWAANYDECYAELKSTETIFRQQRPARRIPYGGRRMRSLL